MWNIEQQEEKKLIVIEDENLTKSSKAIIVWMIIWKVTKMNNDTFSLFAHSDLILLPTWDIVKGNNTSQSLFTKTNNNTSAHYGHQYLIIKPIWDVTKGNNTSLRSLLNVESDSDVTREEKIDRRWKSVFLSLPNKCLFICLNYFPRCSVVMIFSKYHLAVLIMDHNRTFCKKQNMHL